MLLQRYASSGVLLLFYRIGSKYKVDILATGIACKYAHASK